MGTNYYAHMNRCKCCKRADVIHVGKSYRTLRAYREYDATGEIKSWLDWKKWLTENDVVIVDEYDKEVDLEQFINGWKPIDGMSEKVLDDNREWTARFGSNLGDYVDSEGFRFCVRDFS